MNGLELHYRTEALAEELAKFPKVALAWALATQTMTQPKVLLATEAAAADNEAAAITEEGKRWVPVARLVNQKRRLDRISKQLDNLDNPGKKRRKKKRRSKRGRRP